MSHTSIGEFISDDTTELHIYCDGACKGNPGPAGSGLCLYKNGESKPLILHGGFIPKGTNNTAELSALSVALQIAGKYGIANTAIFSDSKYSINSVTQWAYKWKREGWQDRANLEVIKKAHIIYDSIKGIVEVNYVKGHSGVEGNELADRMANMAISKKETGFAIHNYEDTRRILSLFQ